MARKKHAFMSFSLSAALAALAATGSHADPTLVSEGPSPITGGQTEGLAQNAVAGAVNALAAHPANADILYAGAVNGGVWRTTNATDTDPTWTNLTDGLPGQSIGDIVFDTADATNQTLVAGIGLFSSYGRIGGARVGLLRTTDGGDNWTVFAPDLQTRNVSKLAVSGDRILAAINFAENFTCQDVGVYRSVDGGATFEQLNLTDHGIPAGVSTVITPQPGAPDVLYASVVFADICEGSDSGVFRSANGGANWVKVSDAAVDATVNNDTGLTEIEIAPDGTVFIASTQNGRLAGVFQSTDDGTTWTAMDLPGTEEPGFVGAHPGGQGSIHFSLAVDPTDSNIVYVGGDRQPLTDSGGFPNAIGAVDFSGRLFRGDITAPSGSQWAPLTHSGTASSSSPHADSRDMTFDANGRLLESDDGGVYLRADPRSAAGDWFSLNSNLQVTEAHDTAFDPLSQIVITGNQDTGTSEQIFTGDVVWRALQNGDGGDVAVDAVSELGNAQSIRYSSFQFLSSLRRRTYDVNNIEINFEFPDFVVVDGRPFGGQFKTPFVLNQVNPERIVIGGAEGVYESLDRADTAAEIGPDIVINQLGARAIGYGAAGNEDLLFVGSGDAIFRRVTLGDPLTPLALPAGGGIVDIALDRDDPTQVFYIDGQNVNRSTDGGDSFTAITGNLDVPGLNRLRAMAFVPGPDFDALFVGGDRGLAASTSTSGFTSWVSFGTNVPTVPVYEFDYDAAMDTLIVGTLGRGTFSVDDALAELALTADSDGDGIADSADNCTLIANADQRDTNGDGFGNACDADLNNDGIVNVVDLGLLRLVFFTNDPDADFNGDGVVNVIDLGILRTGFFAPPGPSANGS